MTIAIPAVEQRLAAWIFVTIPPVPNGFRGFLASRSICGVTRSTRGISSASGLAPGSSE